MTPQDIAVNVSELQFADVGNITSHTQGTNSYVGQTWTIDDANTWG